MKRQKKNNLPDGYTFWNLRLTTEVVNCYLLYKVSVSFASATTKRIYRNILALSSLIRGLGWLSKWDRNPF